LRNSLKVNGALIEDPHLDRDFTSEFRAFHSSQFRAVQKDCVRIHFFYSPSEDIDNVLDQGMRDERLRVGKLRGLADYSTLDGGGYKGFCVIRPTNDVPLGYTVIARPSQSRPLERILSAQYSTHILGQEFKVHGFPFMEQDGRTGACAQAAVWMALRHIWAADRGQWRTVPTLNAVATSEPGVINSLSVPPGSGGLHPGEMMRAVRNADRIPHYFSSLPAFEKGHLVLKWKKDIDPIAIACRYIDSDIPVILLVGHVTGGISELNIANPLEALSYEALDLQDGHALTAIGYYGNLERDVSLPTGRDHLHVAQWIDGLIVHNDQAGPYIEIPRTHSDKPAKYSCEDIFGLIVPLPDEVFLHADKAEEYAWMFINEMAEKKWQLYLEQTKLKPESWPYPFEPEQLVARTFLTRGFNHYQWLSKAQAHDGVLRLAASLDHSHFVWITEFYRLKDGKPDIENTVAHIVADATAVSAPVGNGSYHAFLFAHLPGRCFAMLPGSEEEVLAYIEGDRSYRSYEFQSGRRAKL
jgi:hypothetical protein